MFGDLLIGRIAANAPVRQVKTIANFFPVIPYIAGVHLCNSTSPSLFPSPIFFGSYTLNTCVDPPHSDKVTGLTFQPSWKRCGDESDHGHAVYMAVTTSVDGWFKSWVLADGERKAEEEMEVGKGKQDRPSWACRSVGYYHNLPCLGASFSQDGSLLALNFKKVSDMMQL